MPVTNDLVIIEAASQLRELFPNMPTFLLLLYYLLYMGDEAIKTEVYRCIHKPGRREKRVSFHACRQGARI
jgi:hypothetical protein